VRENKASRINDVFVIAGTKTQKQPYSYFSIHKFVVTGSWHSYSSGRLVLQSIYLFEGTDAIATLRPAMTIMILVAIPHKFPKRQKKQNR